MATGRAGQGADQEVIVCDAPRRTRESGSLHNPHEFLTPPMTPIARKPGIP